MGQAATAEPPAAVDAAPVAEKDAKSVGKPTKKKSALIAHITLAGSLADGVGQGGLLADVSPHLHRIIERLDKPLDKLTLIGARQFRQDLIAALCRLYFKEGEWTGDSWGTRPDTRGPYYQPETWSDSPRILAKLKDLLAKANPEEAAFMVKEMSRNRIQSDDSLDLILKLANQNPKVIPDAIAQLSAAETLPSGAVPLALGAFSQPGLSATTISQAIMVLAKADSADGVKASLAELAPLKQMPGSDRDFEAASNAFFSSPKLENHHQLIEKEAEKLDGPAAVFADAALLTLAARKTGSPESIQLSQKALDEGWKDAKRRRQIIEAIGAIKHQASASRVLSALNDSDSEVKKAAEKAAKSMRLTKIEDKSPKVASMKPEEVIAAVLKTKGDVGLGEQLFTRATCVACHTVSQDQPQKGPYLGNIAQTYKRPDLAANILDPNKTIAQGFASEMVTLKDGTVQMGFITLEGASEIKMRNVAAQEFTYKTADITKRDKIPASMMPPGLMMNFSVFEFASLLDYLEALSAKK
jgi:putative heme-binding domain-containing protein